LPKTNLIVVAMSGGVDSAVAAALLVEEGCEVVGVTMRLVDSIGEAAPGSCCAPADIDDARSVARLLDIPFYVMDMRREFEERVIRPFADEYARGRTPNPCILCNEFIKFKTLLKRARELNADALATGHHARIVMEDGRRMVAKARDRKKDQSYFLFGLTSDILERIRFPVGEITKEQARIIARELGFKVADKAESQEICFVQEGRYDRLVERYAKDIPQPGDIVAADGRVLGRHKGIHHYTVGQRKGLGVAAGRPLYVMRLDGTARRVRVGFREECASEGMIVENLVWNDSHAPEDGDRTYVRIRHQGREIDATLHPESKKRLRVMFIEPQPAVTPGQAAVFYRGELLQGGGWISPLKNC